MAAEGRGLGGAAGLTMPLARSLERALAEAAGSGILGLSGRKLKEFPRSVTGHDLSDTVQADLSKNRLSEIPVEVCHFISLEMLNLYHNCIRVIPDTVINLQALTNLNLSRNQLSTLPLCICALPLKVLVVSNNKLVSLPEDIGQLKCLMELDVSCNEITVLPQQMGQLQSLRELNVRRNYLQILPEELADLPLVKLDFSCNKIVSIPICYRNMKHLQIIEMDNNPLQCPPAQICIKGKVHVFKYLNIEARRTDKTAECLYQPPMEKACVPQLVSGSIEDIYPDKKHDFDSGIGSDNGDKHLSSTEPLDEDAASLTLQMAHISEEDHLNKQKEYLNVGSMKVESNQETKDFLQRNFEVEEKVAVQGDGLSSEFRTYMKAKEPEEPLIIEEDSSWTIGRIPNTDDHLYSEPEVAGHMSSPEGIVQEEQSDETPSIYLSAKISSYQKGSSMVELEFQRKREIMLEKARHEAQVASHRLKWQKSKQDEKKTPAVTPTLSPDASPTAPFGLKPRSAFFRSLRHIDSLDPQFTIRRKMEQMREEKEHIEQLRENIESRLKINLPEEIGEALMDGVVLCHLVNQIRPRSVLSIHVPSPAVPKLSMAKCRRNVENFLEACRKIGVPEADLCSPYDILQSDVHTIQRTVAALLTNREKVQQPAPAFLTWDLFGFCVFHAFFLVLLYITYNWSVLV
ncbi:leucine-rich repeat and calponin homology domain-containing protein 1-like isoform X5 [Mobula hypostoma]|uniref:leucine-rich repeat and calponin homology domain-containing protein 1-like isoform X5 n=1 Tax=Mobula hypostoma TaxID=723540 RepID=UPI002FC2A32C